MSWIICKDCDYEWFQLDGVDVHARLLPDYLNNYEARIAELEAERRWIPVSERLPDKRLPVLVYTIYGETYSAMLLGEVWTGLHRDFRKGEITHWMPLPEPPKEREE